MIYILVPLPKQSSVLMSYLTNKKKKSSSQTILYKTYYTYLYEFVGINFMIYIEQFTQLQVPL